MKRAIYQDNEGPVKIMVPSEKALKRTGGDITKVRGYPEGHDNCVVCEETELPDDRTFRDAWDLDKDATDATYKGKRVKLNVVKGQAIAKQRIREVRNPKLVEMDIEYQRADEKGVKAEKSAIAAKKQKLRDATDDSRITSAKDEAELKAAMEAVTQEVIATK